MEQNLATRNQNIPSHLQKVSQSAIVRNLNAKSWAEAFSLLPKTIDKTVNTIPMKALARVSENLIAFIEFQLIHVASMVNVDSRLQLQPHQTELIAEELFELYGTRMSIEDLSICFKRGWMGRYDEKLLRVDGAVIGQWCQKYLEEKYAEVERQLMAEKDEQFKKIEAPKINPDEAGVWYQKWLDAIGEPKAPRAITDEEIRKEGQARPHRPIHPSTDKEYYILKELHFQWIRENFDKYGKKLENFVEEDVWLEMYHSKNKGNVSQHNSRAR